MSIYIGIIAGLGSAAVSLAVYAWYAIKRTKSNSAEKEMSTGPGAAAEEEV